VAALWSANGLGRPWRRRWAWRWAACHTTSGLGRARLTLSLFATEGRMLGGGALLTAGRPDAVRRRVVVEGLDHLRAAQARGGVLLLGFHVGPLIEALALTIAGYPTAPVARPPAPLFATHWEAVWRACFPDAAYPMVDLREGESAALYRVYRMLRAGGAVCVTADGEGQVAFEVPTPGGAWVIRAGWLALRRQSGAVTCPVLSHWRGSRVVVSIGRPLPDPDPDPSRDLEACRRILSPLLSEHIRRFPAQCHVREIPVATARVHGDRGASASRPLAASRASG
jgi:lauroyl/myristoyl acyltransferase